MEKVELKKKFDTGAHEIGASVLKIFLWYFFNTFFFRWGTIPISLVLVAILRMFGAKIGKDVRIKPYIHIKYPWKLSMGDHSWLADCYIENLAHVHIGKNVCVSQEAMILTGNHDYSKKAFDLMAQKIILEDGVWIGARAIVCPGVICGTHAVLAAGSVATKNLEPYSVYQGNPAVKVRNRKIV